MAFDTILQVTNLPSGSTVILVHGLTASGVPLEPNIVLPDRATRIAVAATSPIAVAFTNPGLTTAPAAFLVRHDHSIQNTTPKPRLVWNGIDDASTGILATPRWDDVRVPVTATAAYGVNTPVFGKFLDTGIVGPVGGALLFNGTTANGTMSDFGDLTKGYSVCFWVSTSYAGAAAHHVVFKNNAIDISVVGVAGSPRIRATVSGQPALTSAAPMLVGQKNFVAVVISDTAPTVTTIDIYLNGVHTDQLVVGALPGDNANAWFVGQTNAGAGNLAMTLDELRFYQAILNAAQVVELWHAGTGTENEPGGAPALLAGYHFNDAAGAVADNYEGSAGLDMSLTATAWVAGLVGGGSSVGVFTQLFEHGADQELFFVAQLPHAYAEGTDLDVHVHWSPLDASGGDVVWGLELTVAKITDVFPATGVYSLTTPAGVVAKKHLKGDIGTVAGAGLLISSMILGRIYRQGTSIADTYVGAAALLEIDFHIQVNSIGSVTENAK